MANRPFIRMSGCVRTWATPRRPVFPARTRQGWPTRLFSAGPACRSDRLLSASNLARAFRTNPVSFSLAVGCIGAAIGLIGYSYKVYQDYIVDQFADFPEPVAKQLRRALYYANIAPEPEKAHEFFRKALEACREADLDPFSDQVVGIKLAVADMLENAKDIPAAVEVLEHVRAELAKWVETDGPLHFDDGHRSRILARTVGISFKLGELYSWLDDSEAAYKATLWSVGVIVGEQRRREEVGVREGEGDWLSAGEIGAAVEALAEVYQHQDKAHLAIPLFLEALKYCPKDSCHAAVLMSNIGVSILEQSPHVLKQLQAESPAESSDFPTQNEQAQRWFEAALRYATKPIVLPVPTPDRPNRTSDRHPVPESGQTKECDMACIAALVGLGEIAERENKLVDAKLLYNLSQQLATEMGEKGPQSQLQTAVDRVDSMLGKKK